jgi:hypothetical protein
MSIKMSQVSAKRTARRGRLFPEYTIPQEELDRMQAEDEAFYQQCRPIFAQIQTQLMSEYYNWFLVIEPDSGDYFIDIKQEVATQKARQQYPDAWLGIFRLNETGACGMI